MARLFVAAWPPPAVLDRIDALPRPELPGARWTVRDQWHVTLRFLGECDENEAAGALGRLGAAAVEAQLGPQARRLGQRFLVLPVGGLDGLAAEIAVAMAGTGKQEDRAFHGHLTLARARERLRVPPGLDLEARWRVDAVALVRSTPGPQRSTYTTVQEVPLAGG